MCNELLLDELFAFLGAAPSPFHAAAEACRRLDAAGFALLQETAYWNLEPGKGYYLTRGGASVLAWRMPQRGIGGWRITASHSDSPAWRVKADRLENDGCCRLSVEGYGGMNLATWLDRPLTVAGRVLVRTAEGAESRLVAPDRDLCVIPSLAIHMDRDINAHAYNAQTDLQPLFGPAGCRSLTAVLAAELGVAETDLLDRDLVLAVRQRPTRVGPDGAFYLAPRIDDLACAAATLFGFLQAAADADPGIAPVWLMLDSEEVGSGTRQGAASTFVRDVLDRIFEAAPHSAQGQARALANSLALSADNAHAVHPAYPAKADPCCPVRLGGGVVLKYNAAQKYTTTGLTGGLFAALCRRAGVPVQRFANRADQPGGSTLGNLLSRTLPVPMADIGLPQLAMHAAVETAACADADAMVRAAAAFYRARLRCVGDGRYWFEDEA